MSILKLKIQNIFGMMLGIILLLFYIWTWGLMIWNVKNPPIDPLLVPNYFADGFFYVATASAGISSALAIAILGATPPDKMPSFVYLGAKRQVILVRFF